MDRKEASLRQMRLKIIIPFMVGILLGFWVKGGPVGVDQYFYREFFPYFEAGHLHGLMKGLSYLGGGQVVTAFVVLAFIFSYFGRHIRYFVLVLMGGLGSFLENFILKEVFHRLRPLGYMLVDQGGHSYPSGHTMVSTCLWLSLAWIFSENYPKYRKFFYALAVVVAGGIAFSRLGLGVHWPTDIIGGFFFGYAGYQFHLGVWKTLFPSQEREKL